MAFGRVKDRRAGHVAKTRHATGHRAAALLGVATAMLLTAGTLAVSSPAYAAPDKIKVSSFPLDTFTPGSTQTLTVQVDFTKDPDSKGPALVQVSVGGLGNDFTVGNPDGCATPCVLTFDSSDKRILKFPIKATGDLQPGQDKRANGKISVTTLNGPSDTANFDATIKGPDQAASVTQVTGVVKDSNNKPVNNATVAMLDGGSCTTTNRCETATNAKGEFSFKPRPDKPIVPGTIRIGATKSGFEVGQATQDGKAGQAVNVTILLRAKADASASAESTQEALPTQENQPTTDAPAAGAPNTKKTNSDSGPSAFSWIIVALAGLLVLLGVGVIVMMLINRKKGDAEEDGEDDPSGPHTPGGGPGGRGVYGGETAVHGMGAPTVVGGPGAPPMGAGDAATAIIRAQRPDDEYPDPYAAYPASPGGYQPASGGYDPNPNSYGGNATAAYGAGYTAAQPPGYGAPDPQQYSGPPSGYGPGPQHGAPPPAYGSQQGGYDAGQGGYDPRAYQQQQQPGGGYEQQGGYGQQQPGGYGQQGGYAQEPPPPPARDPYYDDQTRHGAPPAGRGGDRRLDWLDD